MFDFQKDMRFNDPSSSCLQPSKQLLADDVVEVALMTELLHRGADAKESDELVSFCSEFKWVVA